MSTTSDHDLFPIANKKFSALTGVPIAGQILQSSGGSYTGLIIFAGSSYIAGVVCFVSIFLTKNRK